MRAILVLAVVACSSQATYTPAPLSQTVAGDDAAFGRGLLAASGNEVRFELNRPAYVTVLRVWQEEGVHASSIELVYPFDPRQPVVARVGPASHQLRFKPGTRRVGLPVPQAAAYVTEFTDARVAAGIASQLQCPVMPRPTDPPRVIATAAPPQGRSLSTGSPGSAPTLAPCVEHVPPTTRQWKWHPAPERLGTHQVLVIVSESRVDLAALARAVDSLDADVTALPRLATALLTGHRGPWAAYVARVD